ncbi:MAG: hypothetical protein Q8P04_01675 [bacterium]|nr:hypothetical protein [bacterium]
MAVGLGVVAATTAGAYFLYGKDAKKRRKQVKSWTLKARGEILEKIEKLSEVNQESYNRVVDDAAKRYSRLKSVNKKELTELVRELKSHWQNINKELKTKPVSRPAKKKLSKR